MQSLLESLPAIVDNSLKKYISINELTRFSVMLNSETAIIGTNKKLMVYTKKWLLINKIYQINWDELMEVNYKHQNNDYFLAIKTNTVELNLPVTREKRPILGELVEKIMYYQE